MVTLYSLYDFGCTEYSIANTFLQDVRKHFNAESRVWMTYRNGVYDVTDFIAKHPGAQNIMLAAGGDVQPFWDIYSVHKGNEQACTQELMLTSY